MDWLTFISELIKAIAWPAVTLVIAFLFRGQIRALLARLKKGKLGPTEFEFEETVKELKQEAVQAGLPPAAETAAFWATYSDPRAVIIDAWLGVERAAFRLAERLDLLVGGGSRNIGRVIRLLQEANAIDPGQAGVLNELRVLRNQATHEVDFSPSADSVVSYVQLAKGLKEALERAATNR